MFQLAWSNKGLWKRDYKDIRAPACPDDKDVTLASPLVWDEHCVECAVPQCYSSCRLYSARRDGNCARFSYGICPNRKFAGLFDYGADLRFKRWAKLEAALPEELAMYPVRKLRWIASVLECYGFIHSTVLRSLPRGTRLFRWTTDRLDDARRGALKKLARAARCRVKPDAFYAKIYSPESASCDLQMELFQDGTVYRNKLRVVPGWNEYTVPFERLGCEPGKDGYLRFWANRDQEIRLIFTWLDLVKFKVKPCVARQIPAQTVKCVAWDLDNTLWRGVIGDDGSDGVVVVPDAVDLIHKLDQRGIIQTIVSKNEYDVAWAKVVELGLDKYFLYPAINWDPKSVNLAEIARELNIGIDSFALIDDSGFERGEVSTAYPQVRVYDPRVITHLLGYDEFDVPVTKETGKRRLKYMEEVKRKSLQRARGGEHDGFLRDCQIELNVRHVLDEDQRVRCLELLQRSNQFNLSGRRYTSDEFETLLNDPVYDNYAFDVHDRYGDYGIVGFVSILKKSEAVIVTDFVMSCRVAKKKVENAFFHWYVNREECRDKNVCVRMRVTGRNQPLRQVFDELKFEVIEETDSEIVMRADLAEIKGRGVPIVIHAGI